MWCKALPHTQVLFSIMLSALCFWERSHGENPHSVSRLEVLVCALLRQKMGWWFVEATKTIYFQVWVVHIFNQTTQSMACWETAYPHCSLGKCQLVLRTSKQSFLSSLRAPTVLQYNLRRGLWEVCAVSGYIIDEAAERPHDITKY